MIRFIVPFGTNVLLRKTQTAAKYIRVNNTWEYGQEGAVVPALDREGEISHLLVFTHADEYGLFKSIRAEETIRSLMREGWVVKVVCCYPAEARSTYPDLEIVGRWDDKTVVTYNYRDDETTTLNVWSEEDYEEWRLTEAIRRVFKAK